MGSPPGPSSGVAAPRSNIRRLVKRDFRNYLAATTLYTLHLLGTILAPPRSSRRWATPWTNSVSSPSHPLRTKTMSSSLVMPSSGAFVGWRDGPAAARFPDQHGEHDEEGSLPVGCLAACLAAMMASVSSMAGSDAKISWCRGREARASMREILRFTGDCSTARAPARGGGGRRTRVQASARPCVTPRGGGEDSGQEVAEREGWLRPGLEGRENKRGRRQDSGARGA